MTAAQRLQVNSRAEARQLPVNEADCGVAGSKSVETVRGGDLLRNAAAEIVLNQETER